MRPRPVIILACILGYGFPNPTNRDASISSAWARLQSGA